MQYYKPFYLYIKHLLCNHPDDLRLSQVGLLNNVTDSNINLNAWVIFKISTKS